MANYNLTTVPATLKTSVNREQQNIQFNGVFGNAVYFGSYEMIEGKISITFEPDKELTKKQKADLKKELTNILKNA